MRAAWVLLLALVLSGCTGFTAKPAPVPSTTSPTATTLPTNTTPKVVVTDATPSQVTPSATPPTSATTPAPSSTPTPATSTPASATPTATPPTSSAPPPSPSPSSPPSSPPPTGDVRFTEGADAGPSKLGKYVASYDLDPDGGWVRAQIRGVPEATLVIGSFFRVRNDDAIARGVSLDASRVTDPYVTRYTIELVDAGGTSRGTLDLRSGAPTLDASIPAGETWDARLTLTLASGAGNDTSFSVAAVRATVIGS